MLVPGVEELILASSYLFSTHGKLCSFAGLLVSLLG